MDLMEDIKPLVLEKIGFERKQIQLRIVLVEFSAGRSWKKIYIHEETFDNLAAANSGVLI